jgi:cell division protein WhiA
MSLSEDVRAELAAIAPARRCDRLAELSGLFHSAGSISLLGRGRFTLRLDVGSAATARRAFALLRDLGVVAEIRTYRQHAFARPTRYQLHVGDDEAAIATLAEAGVVDRRGRPLGRPPWRVTGRTCCRRAYLRGAFLGAGSLSGPRSPHLELRIPAVEGARFLRDVAAREGIRLGLAERASHVAVYAKGWEPIEAVLAAAGASDAVLALEERAVVAATRAQANRLANADHANLVRTTRAAQEQLAAARRLRERGSLERLPRRLSEAAELRLRCPTLPLAELARRAEPPATKAGMQRRLARVVELARRA